MLAYGGNKPVKIICPGVVYRRDDDDATHSHQFMQIEGLVVDESSSMSDLKGTLLELVKTLFGDDRNIRLIIFLLLNRLWKWMSVVITVKVKAATFVNIPVTLKY